MRGKGIGLSLWSLQTTAPIISRSLVQCQAPVDLPFGFLLVPLYGLSVLKLQDLRINARSQSFETKRPLVADRCE